jgi:hypothetical protein
VPHDEAAAWVGVVGGANSASNLAITTGRRSATLMGIHLRWCGIERGRVAAQRVAGETGTPGRRLKHGDTQMQCIGLSVIDRGRPSSNAE